MMAGTLLLCNAKHRHFTEFAKVSYELLTFKLTVKPRSIFFNHTHVGDEVRPVFFSEEYI